MSLYLRMPLRETAIGRATVAIRRCIEQGIPTFRPRLFRDQLLGRYPAAMGSSTVLSTVHIPAKSIRIRARTMALARPNPRRGRWPFANKCSAPGEGRAAKCCTPWINGGGGPTWTIFPSVRLPLARFTPNFAKKPLSSRFAISVVLLVLNTRERSAHCKMGAQ